VWYLRGNQAASAAIDALGGFRISVVTYAELLQGMRDKAELAALRRSIAGWNARVVYLSEEVSAKALLLVEQHFHSGSLQFADALIASTALSRAEALLTANDRHYRMVEGLQIKRFRP